MTTTFTAQVIDLTSDGWGVVKSAEGEVAFVPGAWPGDEIEYEIVSQGKFNLGKVIRWLQKSTAHRESPCPHWGRSEGQCGACAWMDINYNDQLKAKEDRLRSILKRFKLAPSEILPIQASQEFHYRNRVKLSSDGKNLGFMSPQSHSLAAIASCLVAENKINQEIAKLRTTTLDKKEYWLPTTDFAQGNSEQNLKMREALASLLDKNYGTGLELFCGDGNFTELLSKKVETLHAYESSGEAVDKLRIKSIQSKNRILAQKKNLYSQYAVAELSKENAQAEILFLDPPRSGFKDLASLVKNLKSLTTVIYLSCDPMTFARDLASLLDASPGWSFKKAFPFDLFPQTPHVEVMGYLERN